MTMAVVAIGKCLGGGFLGTPNADVSDRYLDIVVMKSSGSFKIIDELVDMQIGNYTNDDNMLFAQTKKRNPVKSKERDVMLTIEGEPVGINRPLFSYSQKH